MTDNDKVITMLSISDFSRTPSGRYRTDGDHNGQLYREEFLVPALKDAISRKVKLIVNLDGLRGLPPSFREEVFGGIVRHGIADPKTLKETMEINASTERGKQYIAKIWNDIGGR